MWRVAEVVGVVPETPRVRTIAFDVPGWPGHRAGQHVDIRLVAEDGYSAQRSYSIASVPDGIRVELTVQRLEDGEVSPYLTDEVWPGDRVELRAPSAATSSGSRRRAGRCCSSLGARALCR
jgi:ferredoxin-NADP reductase